MFEYGPELEDIEFKGKRYSVSHQERLLFEQWKDKDRTWSCELPHPESAELKRLAASLLQKLGLSLQGG